MDLRRYSQRHDALLRVIGDFIHSHLLPHFSITLDISSTLYSFPQHIISTDQGPDIVWWSDERKELHLFKLTVSFESKVADARARKVHK